MKFRKTRAGFGRVSIMALLMAALSLWALGAIAGVNKDLIAASWRGNLPEVQRLLAKGADVNAMESQRGETALMLASQKGHRDIVQLLLAKGANVNTKSKWGGTALMFASLGGHREVVEALLAKGAKVNVKTDNGMTPLMFAAASGHREIVQMLLDKGADVNAMSKTGRTALGEVLMSGRPHPEIREMLIRAGADPGTEQAWRKYHLPPPEKLPGVR